MKKVIIVGAGVAGKDVLREINKSPELGFSVFGFIDDNPEKKGTRINGTKVLGDRTYLQKVLSDNKIDEVIIAIPSADGERVSDYVKICSDNRIDCRIVPRVKEIIEGQAHVKTLRKVQVEDLLGRPIIKSDVSELKKFFGGKVVLVTGAAGSIGSELSRQVAAYRPKSLILYDWWENGLFELQLELNKSFPRNNFRFVVGSIQDKKRIDRVITDSQPNFIFHAAAYKHVPAMEDNPEEAVKNNILGTYNVAISAKKHKVNKFVIVSTDKAANPISVMGASKLITEGIAKKLNGKTKFIAVRFGNVLDSFGSVVPIFRKQIDNGGPVTITDKKMTRYFMTIPEAAQLILKATLIGNGGELFVLDMGKPVKIFDLAQNMIRLSGLIPGKDIKITYTGRRRGEKMNEQLFNSKENLLSTKEEKIFKTESLGFDVKKLPEFLKVLSNKSASGDGRGIRREFRKLIKNFPA